MRPQARTVLFAWLLGLSAAVAEAAPSVVVAIDASRSLPAESLAAMGETAATALGSLPRGTAVGVLTFDDAPHWLLRSGSPAEAANALGGLRRAGSYTLLDDGLFTAVRELAPGGVVLLLTDGRDENSATTVEDVARASEARGVRIVAVGAGQKLDERTLRRLALLTGGSYLGHLGALSPASVGEALATTVNTPSSPHTSAVTPTSASGREAGDSRTASNPPRGTLPATLRSDGPGASPASRSAARPATAPLATVSRTRTWWWLVPATMVAAAVPLIAWAAKRGRKRTTFCRRCAGEVPVGGDCPKCAAQDAELALQERLRGRNLTRFEEASELRLESIQELTTGAIDLDAIEKTRVITDQAMLLIREPGESQRSFLLRNDGAFAVGRDPRSNTLTLRDPALSAKHFKVVPDDGYYFVVDLESTNGTYLNKRRVRAARLASGDLIQAGQVELEFRAFLGQVA